VNISIILKKGILVSVELGQTLEAYGAGTAGYIITGYSRKGPVARGYVSIYNGGGQIPDQGTIIIDGTPNYAVIRGFLYENNDYVRHL